MKHNGKRKILNGDRLTSLLEQTEETLFAPIESTNKGYDTVPGN